MLAASTLPQPNVPLSSPPAVSLVKNSSSAASWPMRNEERSLKFCSYQAVNSRVVGNASMLLGSARLPLMSAALRPPLWIWNTVTWVVAPRQPISFSKSASTENSSRPS